MSSLYNRHNRSFIYRSSIGIETETLMIIVGLAGCFALFIMAIFP